MPRLKETIALAEELWPLELAESWDSIGLITGEPNAEISTVLFCVDPTHEVIDEAMEIDAELIISHHPLYLGGTTNVAATNYKGSVIHRLIKNNIALYNAHTNADSAHEGVNDQLAYACGLKEFKPLIPQEKTPELGLGRVGNLPEKTSLKDLAARLAKELPATVTGIRVAGNPEQEITRIAVCGGAGDSLFDAVRANNAEVYVTSDLRHHPALEATQDSPLCIIDTAHYASESLWLPAAAEQFAQEGYKTKVSDTTSDPWDFVVVQSEE
ncbi:MAG: Nif3-like dinuclear metal center hexameric protein [Micrococcaceae bacterium]